MNKDTVAMLARLNGTGITMDDAYTLRRVAMTLHRWQEMECGDSNGSVSWCITRGRKTNGSFVYDDDGSPFLEEHRAATKTTYRRVPDRERGALRRLASVMARYPTLTSYVQGDPRGAALYILRPGDIPEGGAADAYYSRGIAVYK